MALFANKQKVKYTPHTLRLVIFLLRLALGLDFFYLGWSTLWSPSLARDLSVRSFGDLYTWLRIGITGNLQTYFAWAFVIAGACLVIGLFTRTMAFVSIAIIIYGFSSNILAGIFHPVLLVNNTILAILGLLIIIASGAGKYLGLDMFFLKKAA